MHAASQLNNVCRIVSLCLCSSTSRFSFRRQDASSVEGMGKGVQVVIEHNNQKSTWEGRWCLIQWALPRVKRSLISSVVSVVNTQECFNYVQLIFDFNASQTRGSPHKEELLPKSLWRGSHPQPHPWREIPMGWQPSAGACWSPRLMDWKRGVGGSAPCANCMIFEDPPQGPQTY